MKKITKANTFKPIRWILIILALSVVGYILIISQKKPLTPEYTISISKQSLDEVSVDDIYYEEPEYVEAQSGRENVKKVAIIINGMGLNETLTNFISSSVSENISVALSPYTRDIDKTAKSLKNVDKEAYINLIISSDNFKSEDDGPKALMLKDNVEKDLKNVSELVGSSKDITGVVIDGYIDENKSQALEKILSIINENNLILIDATDNDVLSSLNVDGLKRIRADLVIGDDITKENLQNFLDAAASIAKDKDKVVIVTTPKPANVFALIEWSKMFYDTQYSANPVALVPISSLVTK